MRYVSFALGLILIIGSLFANALGIDNDPGWGLGRSVLLASRLALVLPALGVILYKHELLPRSTRAKIASAVSRLRGWIQRAARFYPLTDAANVLVCKVFNLVRWPSQDLHKYFTGCSSCSVILEQD